MKCRTSYICMYIHINIHLQYVMSLVRFVRVCVCVPDSLFEGRNILLLVVLFLQKCRQHCLQYTSNTHVLHTHAHTRTRTSSVRTRARQFSQSPPVRADSSRSHDCSRNNRGRECGATPLISLPGTSRHDSNPMCLRSNFIASETDNYRDIPTSFCINVVCCMYRLWTHNFCSILQEN